MPHSQSLAERVRFCLRGRKITEKRMFGGLSFLFRGNLLVGVWQQSLVARIGAAEATAALEQEFVGVFPDEKRPMKGWVTVAPEALESDRALSAWIEAAFRFVETLPAK